MPLKRPLQLVLEIVFVILRGNWWVSSLAFVDNFILGRSLGAASGSALFIQHLLNSVLYCSFSLGV